jgi:cystathionine beta-lyase/cystathionine gamma-synthase
MHDKIWPLASAIYPSSVYNFTDIDDLDSYFAGSHGGYLYARDGHPNADELAKELAEYHLADWASVTSSGMSALCALFLSRLGPGKHLLASRWLYGKTILLIRDFEKRGTRVTWFNPDHPDELRSLISQTADLVLVESISNPLVRIADLSSIANICSESGSPLAVDNTFPTPVFLKPLSLGADFVVESLTKLINGHSDATLGMVAGSKKWKKYFQPFVSLYGLNSSPFDCWLTSRGLETLRLRVQTSEENARKLALWLKIQQGVLTVHHPSLPCHADHSLAQRMMPIGTCNIVSFEVSGGRDGAQSFFRACKSLTLSPSLGHTSTTLSYPAGTSHRGLSPEEREAEGIGPGLIRVSTGIEPFETIREGFAKGLAAVSQFR